MLLEDRLRCAGQESLVTHLAALDEASRHTLEAQLDRLDLDRLARLVERHLRSSGEKVASEVEEEFRPPLAIELPHDEAAHARAERSRELGWETLRTGRVAVLLVAGGQATRLGFSGPKGLVPIGPLSGKTLFEWHADKLGALARRIGRPIPWLIMTGPANDESTRDAFEESGHYGLSAEDLFFFCQGTVPAVDLSGSLLLTSPEAIFENPDGHGGMLEALDRSGGLAWLRERQVDHLFYFQVDNPLLPIADPLFLGHHLDEGAQMSSKVVEKLDPAEKVGIIGRRGDRCSLIEYSDLPGELASRRDPDGRLRFRHGNIAAHLFDVTFLEKMAGSADEWLPFHAARKAIPHLASSGEWVHPTEPNGLKFERFIFDLLPQATRSVVLTVDRAQEFSPVKNREGTDTAELARRALIDLHAGWLESIGIEVPRDDSGSPRSPIEIGAGFALDREELAQRLESDLGLRRQVEETLVRGEPLLLDLPAFPDSTG